MSWCIGDNCSGAITEAAVQLWQPRGLCCSCDSHWGCTAAVAAIEAVLQLCHQLWQPTRLHCSEGSRGSYALGMAADGTPEAAPRVVAADETTLQGRQPRGLRCNGGSQGAALQVLQPMGLHCSEGGRGGCATMVTAGRMRCGCRSHGGCAAGVVCDVVAPMVWQREPLPQPIGLH